MKAIAVPARTRVPSDLDHEDLAVKRGERSGVLMAVAVHSTRPSARRSEAPASGITSATTTGSPTRSGSPRR